MNYSLKAYSSPLSEGKVQVESNELLFGVTKSSDLASPADLLTSAFAACCLKNVERFSEFMKYNYSHAEIEVTSYRQDHPPMINRIDFELTVYNDGSKINSDLLLRNLQKFGTIYNTLHAVCEIHGEIFVKQVES